MNAPYLGPEVTPAVLTGITTTLDELTQQLSFAVGLSQKDKLRYQAMGRNRVQFVNLTLEHLQQNPALVPPYLNVEAIKRNLGLHDEIQRMREITKQVQRLLADTVHYTGAKAASDALAYYSVVKRAAKMGVPGTEVAVQTMKASLKGAKRLGDTPPSDAPGDQPAT